MSGRSRGTGTGGAGAGRIGQPRRDNPLPEQFRGRDGGRGRCFGASDDFAQSASQFPALFPKMPGSSSSLTSGQHSSGRGRGTGRGSAGLTESHSQFPALVRTNVTSSSIFTAGQQPSGRSSDGGRGSGGPAGNTAPSLSLTREVEQLSLKNKAPIPVQLSVLPVVQAPAPILQSQPEGGSVRPPPAPSKALRIPIRPGFGKVGRKCTVRANHFLVHVGDKDLHHYDVRLHPLITITKYIQYLYAYIPCGLLLLIFISISIQIFEIENLKKSHDRNLQICGFGIHIFLDLCFLINTNMRSPVVDFYTIRIFEVENLKKSQ